MASNIGQHETEQAPRVCVFDVNETLLDLAALDHYFETVFFNTATVVRRQWFNQVLQMAFVDTIVGTYHDFATLGDAALTVIAEQVNTSRYPSWRLTDEQRQTILGGMRKLPPHPDVHDALSQLRLAGLRLYALTNSTLQVAEAQLTFAGIRDYFDGVFSADTVHRLKPAREVYTHAAQAVGVPIERMRLIAAHGWDVTGAMHAGAAAAFVARPGAILSPLAPQPDIIGKDLVEVASAIIEREADGSQSHI